MSEMANRPMIEEAIMKVRYLHDVIESQGTDEFGYETEESESKSESEGNSDDDKDDNSYSRQGKRKRAPFHTEEEIYEPNRSGDTSWDNHIMPHQQHQNGWTPPQLNSLPWQWTEEFTGYTNYGNYRLERPHVRFSRRQESYGNVNSQDTGGKGMYELNRGEEQEYTPPCETNVAKASLIIQVHLSVLTGMVVEIISESEEGWQSRKREDMVQRSLAGNRNNGTLTKDMTTLKVEPAEDFFGN
ncbi:hypothetical protein L873DRAFT_1790418 [Choiromyces venosus 120613-1]|uniref:Uncharacterized protein n=1 Tax=Choiromyces venosus 120613-1 TaxID=1336337 RepID=A0A3N4JJ34_9PEZI|nr:hypothetical protein L873DRAFT_1790418 [Choiromyces venosus 120613-1]